MCVEAMYLINDLSCPNEVFDKVVRRIRQYYSTNHIWLRLTLKRLVINSSDGYKRYMLDRIANTQGNAIQEDVLILLFERENWPMLINEPSPIIDVVEYLLQNY